MQFLSVNKHTRLNQLSDLVGDRNVEYFLAVNNLERRPDIGGQLQSKYQNILKTLADVTPQRKLTILNALAGDSDIFEKAALLDGEGWKILDTSNAFEYTLRVPDVIKLPDSTSTLGNNTHIPKDIYQKVLTMVSNPPHIVDPAVFNEYSTIRNRRPDEGERFHIQSMNWFPLPWGQITLYSSLSDDSMDFPVYPEVIQDGVSATYSTMPDMIYQYEPWYVYHSSGPRTNTYSFHMHRDMFTGDHRDGRANKLIRFCEANCYPDYNGAAVNTSTVTLYIAGKPLIHGIATDCKTSWDGPILSDGWPAEFKLELTIVEIAQEPLSYDRIKSKGLIG